MMGPPQGQFGWQGQPQTSNPNMQTMPPPGMTISFVLFGTLFFLCFVCFSFALICKLMSI